MEDAGINPDRGNQDGHVDQGAARTGESLPILGDFELIREVGRGGMGTVYIALQRSLQRTVAVKVLGSQVSSSRNAILRFQREARAAAKLNHAHIVPIFALGEEDGVNFYAMEYIDGPGLNRIIADAKKLGDSSPQPMELAETVALPPGYKANQGDTTPGDLGSGSFELQSAAQFSSIKITDSRTSNSDGHFREIAKHIMSIADALEYAHGEGVIHRDIKPHNLLMGSDGKLRITDFGLARLAEQPGVTATGEMIGSPLYMSPEQIGGGPHAVDHRADVYSLGATLYEWLALTTPYPGETREQVIGKILTSQASAVAVHNSSIPQDLQTICHMAIERDPARRYQAAGELRDDLRRYLENRPIKAKRTSVVVRISRFVGRHRVASMAVASVVLAMVMGLALLSKGREARTQSAAIAEAIEDKDVAIDDLLRLLAPKGIELSGPLSRVADAAIPILESVVPSTQTKSSGGEGASSVTGSTLQKLAVRATRDFFETRGPWQMDGTEREGSGANLNPLFGQLLGLWQTDISAALRLVDEHLTSFPSDSMARQCRAALLGRQGKFDEMLAETEFLLRLNRNEGSAYFWRGLAFVLNGQGQRAISDIDRGDRLGGDYAWSDVLRGLALTLMSRHVEAISSFYDALELDPELVVALLGRAASRAALGNADGAVTDLSLALMVEPENVDALVLRGTYSAEIGDYDAAIRDYNEAMQIVGRTPTLLLLYYSAVTLQRGRAAPARFDRDPQQAPGSNPPALNPDPKLLKGPLRPPGLKGSGRARAAGRGFKRLSVMRLSGR